MAKPLVSVISAYYNREDHVAESIQSLLDQTYENLEIIIIDDGSKDGTFKRLSEFSDPRLKVVTHDNIGLVRSFRKAIEMSKGEYIAVHGSGDISYPRRIEAQAKLLQSQPRVGVVGCHVKNINTHNGFVSLYKNTVPENLTASLQKENIYTHGEVMYRRSVYERVGGYRTFFLYAQDRDLWLRMSRYTEFAMVEEVLYDRLTLADGVNLNLEKRALQAYLADFAGQCMAYRLTQPGEQRDLLDVYGERAPFFRRKSPALAKKLQLYTTYALLRRDVQLAQRLNQLSIQETRGPRNSLMQGLLALISGSKTFHSVFFYALFKLRDVNRLVKRTDRGKAARGELSKG